MVHRGAPRGRKQTAARVMHGRVWVEVGCRSVAPVATQAKRHPHPTPHQARPGAPCPPASAIVHTSCFSWQQEHRWATHSVAGTGRTPSKCPAVHIHNGWQLPAASYTNDDQAHQGLRGAATEQLHGWPCVGATCLPCEWSGQGCTCAATRCTAAACSRPWLQTENPTCEGAPVTDKIYNGGGGGGWGGCVQHVY
jgi:hypothetical protein